VECFARVFEGEGRMAQAEETGRLLEAAAR
jgi:hypothetical protein